MCSRCMRVVEERGTIGDEQSSLAPTEEYHEDEERSLLDNGSECSQAAYRPGVSIKVRNCFYFKTLLIDIMRGLSHLH